jgi:hypothetical protein
MLSGPSVGVAQQPTQAPKLITPNFSGSKAIGMIGSALAESAGDVVDAGVKRIEAENDALLKETQKEAAQARKEAEAIAEADSLLDLDSRMQSASGEFFKTKGLSASSGRAAILEQFRKDRDEISKRLPSSKAEAAFRVRSAELVMAASRQVEHHVGREYESAREGTMKALTDGAIAKAEAGALDPLDFPIAQEAAVRTIRDTQRSEEDGAQRIADFKSRMSGAFAQGLVAQGRTAEAAQYVEASRATLGGRYVEAKTLVDRANAGAEEDRLTGEAAKLVDGSADAVRNADGYVTEDELLKAVPVEGYDADTRKRVETQLRQRMQAEHSKFKADNQTHRDNVNRSDLPGQKADAQVGKSVLWLEQYDPDFLLARDARKRAEFRSWKASKSGDARERAAEAKAQREVDLQFRYRLEHRLVDDPNAKPDDVLQEFIAERAKEGDDVTVTATERERGGASAAKATKKAGTEEGAQKKADAARIDKVLTEATKKGLKKGEKVDPSALNDEVGRNLLLYQAKVEANGGKPLDETQWSAFEAFITREMTVERPGRIYGTNTVNVGRPGQHPIEGPAAPPKPQKAPTITVRRKADGKLRTLPADAAQQFLADPAFEEVK